MQIPSAQFLGVSEDIFGFVEGASFAIASAPTGELGADFLELAQEHMQLQQTLGGYRQAIGNKDRDAIRKAQREMGNAVRAGGQQSWSAIVEKLKASGLATRPGFLNTPSFQEYHQRTMQNLEATLVQPFRDVLTTIQPLLDKIIRAQEETATLTYRYGYQAAEPTFITSYSDYDAVINELDRIEFQPSRETFESALLLFDYVATILDRRDELWRPIGRVDLTITNLCAHVNRIRATFLGYLKRPEQAARAEEITAQHHMTMARVVSENHPQEAIKHYEQAYAYYKECVEYYISQRNGHELMRVGLLAIDTIEEAVLICHRLRDETNFSRYRIDQSNLGKRLLKSGSVGEEGHWEIIKRFNILHDHGIAFYQQLGDTPKILQARNLKIRSLSTLLHICVERKIWDKADQTFSEFIQESNAAINMLMLLENFPNALEGIQAVLQNYDWMADTLQQNDRLKEALHLRIQLLTELDGFLVYERLLENKLGRDYFGRITVQIIPFYEKTAELLRTMEKWEKLAQALQSTGLGFQRDDGSLMHPLEALLKNYSTILAKLRTLGKSELIQALEDREIDLQKFAQEMENFLSSRIHTNSAIEGDFLVMRDPHGEILVRVPVPPETKEALTARIKGAKAKKKDPKDRTN